MTSALETGATALWRIDLDGAATAVAAIWSAQALRPLALAGPADARRQTANMALRLLLAREVGRKQTLSLGASESGKPRLANDAIAFNLSHSQGLALVALSRCGEIGVDVEAHRAMPLPEGRRAVIEAAAAAVAGGRDLTTSLELRTLQAWVRLEAVAKATGEGIGSLLQRLHVRPGRALAELTGCETPPVAIACDIDVGCGFIAAAAAMRDCLPALQAAPVIELPNSEAGLNALFADLAD